MTRRLLCLALLLASGCIATAAPRFPPDVAAALANHPMRRLATQSLYVYYPAGRGDEARRVAGRIEGCVAALRHETVFGDSRVTERMTVILPPVPFNNAYVAPIVVGYDDLAVVPSFNTWDFETELGIPPDPSYIACHEITHYVHARQVASFWGVMNKIFGDVVTPQIGLDAWFWEGLATYTETRLQPGVGRMAWPMWRGVFHAGVAGQGVSGGDLSEYNRDFHFGNHYLFGSHFVSFLAERYGEEKLWQLVGKQGESWFFFMAQSWRFYDVYGRSLSSLIDDFSDWTRHKFPVHARPPEQAHLRDVGEDARYAQAPGGREAFVVNDHDLVTELWVYEPDGRRIRTRKLNELLPARQLAQADPVYTSGLSFTADGKAVYFAIVDAGIVEQEVRLMRYDVDADQLVQVGTLGGPGGSVSPDGRSYYYAHADGDRHDLAVLDVATGKATMVLAAGPQQYVGSVRPSPDGKRLAIGIFDGGRFTVWIIDAESGAKLGQVPGAAGATDASWADAHRIVYLQDVERTFQVMVWDVDAPGAPAVQVTHAPYLAFEPRVAAGGTKLRFLDREGWGWQLAEQALPAAAPATPAAPPAPAADAAPAPAADAAAAPAPAAPAAPATSATVAPATAALVIDSDAPYSTADHFFYPQLRSIVFGATADQLSYGLSLGGADRLEFHRWALTVLYQPKTDDISALFGLSLSAGAPWTVVFTGAALHWGEKSDSMLKDLDVARRQVTFSLLAARAWGGLSLSFGGLGSYEGRGSVTYGGENDLAGVAGPTMSIAYTGADGSPYAGAQRLFHASADASYFPSIFDDLEHEVVDLRSEVRWRFAPPLSRRHTFELRGRLHGLLIDGRDPYAGYGHVQVGGEPDVLALGRRGTLNPEPNPPPRFDELAPGISFYEDLRGFEDYTLYTDRMGFGDATYTYPIIIDHGFASSLYLFPAFFLRQLDLQLFGAAAEDLGKDVPQAMPIPDGPVAPARVTRRFHAAAGGALALKLVFWRVPFALKYQIARRFTDDHAMVQEFGLSFAF